MVFSVRVVLISLALVLVLGAIFVGVSIFYRMYRREFIYKLGWVEVSVAATAARDARAVEERYQRMLSEARERVVQMEARAERAAASLDEITPERDRLREKLAKRGRAR